LPGGANDVLQQLRRGHFAGRLSGSRIEQRPRLADGGGFHERLRDPHRDVEAPETLAGQFRIDELPDVRMIDAQHAHVGSVAFAPFPHALGGAVEQAHERDRPRAGPAGRGHHVAPRPQAREGEPRTPSRLLDQGHELERAEDTLDAVFHRQHEAGAQLSLRRAGVHERGRIGEEVEPKHGLPKRLFPAGRFAGASERRLGLGDAVGHAPE
jgi:hypothetical protein